MNYGDDIATRLFFRPVDRPIAKYLSKTQTTPNTVTILSLVLAAIAVSIMYTSKGYSNLVIACILIYFSNVFDGVDGQLAKLKNMCSDFGNWLDTIVDRAVEGGLLVAIALLQPTVANITLAFLLYITTVMTSTLSLIVDKSVSSVSSSAWYTTYLQLLVHSKGNRTIMFILIILTGYIMLGLTILFIVQIIYLIAALCFVGMKR